MHCLIFKNRLLEFIHSFILQIYKIFLSSDFKIAASTCMSDFNFNKSVCLKRLKQEFKNLIF